MTFRPVGEFLDLSAFKIPQQQELTERITLNLSYYAANYLAIYSAFLLYLCIHYPSLLFAVIAIVCAGVYLFNMRQSPIIIAGKVFTKEEVRLIYAATAVMLVVYVGGYPVLYVTAVAALIALAHAALRQRTLKARGATAFTSAATNIKNSTK